MKRTIQASRDIPSEASVLTTATLRASERMGLSRRELSVALGVSPASLSRLSRGRAVDPGSKTGELALMVVRLFRSLDALVGGDEEAGRRWLRAENSHLAGVPAQLIRTVEGLVRVVDYLDAMRGKL
ncbi:MAG: DUF2384 domain-containing protein [Acidobacteriota bacterium]|nr:DUF2384 domain-containing protein [Acidobacteriota bacterium]